MTLSREGTTLVIVDVQERLFPAMDADHREEVMRNIKILAAAARRLQLPVVATEQYPKGLGHTLSELRDALGPEVQPVPKVSFSCWGAEEVRVRLGASRTRRVILAGIEAHVCVLISALELMSEGITVHVPADEERFLADRRLAPFISDAVRTRLLRPPTPTLPPDIESLLATVRVLRTAGARLLAGTDGGSVTPTVHGVSLHRELELLVAEGLRPTEALTAATAMTADTFRLTDRGRIAAGRRADLVMVRGDPTTDIAATRDIMRVWRSGVEFDRRPVR
jgi:hypothetical protein